MPPGKLPRPRSGSPEFIELLKTAATIQGGVAVGSHTEGATAVYAVANRCYWIEAFLLEDILDSLTSGTGKGHMPWSGGE